MRYLGIDYGSKRVGVAISDEMGQFAFPYEVIPNDSWLVTHIRTICVKEGIENIVIGESKDRRGEDNAIMKDITIFADDLKKDSNLKIFFESELYTSKEAERIIGKDELYDARAAALILKHYLDRQHYA